MSSKQTIKRVFVIFRSKQVLFSLSQLIYKNSSTITRILTYVATTHDGNTNIIFAYIDLIPFNLPNSSKMKTLAIPLLRIVIVKNIGTERNEK